MADEPRKSDEEPAPNPQEPASYPPYPQQPYPQQPYPYPYQGQGQQPAHAAYPAPGYPYPYPYPYGYPPARPPEPAFPHDRPRQYHQILRTHDYAWWKPVVGVLLVLVGSLVIVPLAALPILVFGAAMEDGRFFDNLDQLARFERVSPASMLYLNVSLGATILVAWLAIRVVHGLKPRWLSSVAPRLRWNFLFACLVVSVVALVAALVVGLFLPSSAADDSIDGALNEFTPTIAWFALIILLTTPFQAAGEEYVFRGYLFQALGSLVDRGWWRWAAIIVTSLLFATAHGYQNVPLFFDRFMFGLIAGWLTVRTGGLEAGIAMHVLNNYLAFGFALAVGDITDSLTVSEVSWWNIVATLTQSGVYALGVIWLAKRFRLDDRSRPPTPSAPQQAL